MKDQMHFVPPAIHAPYKVHKQQTREEMIEVIKQAMFDFGEVSTLSEATGLSQSCLFNIRNGTTKWPRWTTMELIMVPLKLELSLHRTDK